MARNWYAYTGAPGFENIVGNYILASFDINYCIGGTNVCVIYARNGGPNPLSITQNLRNYMVASKAASTYFPNGRNQTPYVYSRPT